jgi:hypothetical protein
MSLILSGTDGLSDVDGSAATPAIRGTDANTGIFFPAADTIAFSEGGTEAARFDSSGNFMQGTTSWGYSGNKGIQVRASGSDNSSLFLETASATIKGFMASDPTASRVGLGSLSNHPLVFIANDAERARITSGGDFVVGTTTTPGQDITSGTGMYYQEANGFLYVRSDGQVVGAFNRGANDGVLVEFKQDQTIEGTISVSGTTVSYNGGHLARYSQLLNGQRDESIVKGTVLSNLDDMCEWFDAEGNPLPNEQLNRTKVSDVEGDINVAGVFVNWDNDDQDNPYDMNIAMTGDMIIRIAQGVTVQKGDLLMSAGDGTAKPQGDDIVRSKTVAKVTSSHVTCTYDDGSYCVPCVLMAC